MRRPPSLCCFGRSTFRGCCSGSRIAGSLLPALALALAGCAPEGPAAAAGARAFVDGLAREVRLVVPARRIVSLAPSNTEILFALGAGDQVVGRDDVSDFPPGATRLPALGTTAGRLNVETLLGLQPDLVLVAGITSADRARSLAALGLTLYYLPNPTSFEELFSNLRTVGVLCGRAADAERQAAGLRERVQAVARRIAGLPRPRVFYELDSTDPARPWSAGPGTFIDLLIRQAGGENFCGQSAEEFPRVSIESLLVGDPDAIVIGSVRDGVTVEAIGRRTGWGALSAVRRGAVATFDGDLASRPGPRLVDGLERLAEILHPTGAGKRQE